MGIDATQLRDYIIKPFLTDAGLYSLAAEQLMLGTCAVESGMGTYLAQNKGSALGLFQIEPFSHQDIWVNYLNDRSDLAKKILYTCGYVNRPPDTALIYHLGYATLIARIKYLRSTQPLPDPNNVYAMGKYWKLVYNSLEGKGTETMFQDAYLKYVQSLYK